MLAGCTRFADSMFEFEKEKGRYPHAEEAFAMNSVAKECGYSEHGDYFVLNFRSRGWDKMGQYVYFSNEREWLFD